MSNLEILFKAIEKESKRIEMFETTKGVDVDFMRDEIYKAKLKKVELQILFDREYKRQNK